MAVWIRSFLVAIGLCLLGWVVSVPIRLVSMEGNFSRIHPGMTHGQVQAIMGAPLWVGIDGDSIEFRYGIFPVPSEFVIALKNGKVSNVSMQTSA